MNLVSLDIGGTLAKICFTQDKNDIQIPDLQNLRIEYKNYLICFNFFFSNKIQEIFQFLIRYFPKLQQIYITGGGAIKYNDQFKQYFKDIELIKINEFESLVNGLQFIHINQENSIYTYQRDIGKKLYTQQQKYPFLLVNVGSGISIIKFEEKDKYTRVSGSSLGGGMFLGIANLLIQQNDFEQLLELSHNGDSQKVDLYVKDLYEPQDNEKQNKKDIAISLAKLQNKDEKDINQNDLSKSLLCMISFNISQLAQLWAEKEKCECVYFAGNFIKNHEETMDHISYGFRYYTQIATPLFLKHDGYLGVLGCIQNLM